jgi:hypothetical protein
MRHIMVTPHISHQFLARSLRDLRFEEIMMGFGMFFLQELDLETIFLPDIQDDDGGEVQKAYGNAIKAHKKKRNSQDYPILALTSHARQKEYPWGSNISWKTLENLLSTIPDQFLQKVEFDHKNLHLPESKLLFIQFSGEIWLSTHTSYLKGGQCPYFDNFKAAMDLWTVEGLQKVVTSFRIIPSGHGLHGCPPRHTHSQQSFQDRMSIYFPLPSMVSSKQGSLWQHYSHNTAYLGVYHRYLKVWDRGKTNLLNDDLRLIFSHLQCLPMDAHNKPTPIIWQAHQNKLQFIANPKYYPIIKIGQPSKIGQTTQKAQLPSTIIEQKIFEDKYVNLQVPLFFRKI